MAATFKVLKCYRNFNKLKNTGTIPGFIACCFLLGMGSVLMPAVTSPKASGDNHTASLAKRKSLSTIKSLPYLQGYKPAPKKAGVIRYDEEAAYQGLNFYVSAAEPGAFLVDMQGDPVHRWTVTPGEIGLPEESHCRRAYLFSNGNLLGIFEGNGALSGPLVKLDRDSRILWIYRGDCHHDLFVAGDGRIYVLTHRERNKYPGQNLTGPILEDFITVLSREGKEIKSVSLIKCFLNSPYFYVIRSARTRGDIFHTNTLEVLNGKMADQTPVFKKGRVLISIRNLSVIALVDLEEEKVCWMLWGMWNVQHQPTVLENGNLLLFDNSQASGGSRVIEFNPLTQEIVWSYRGDVDNSFYSRLIGSNQRLPNGNTLITESETGRAFEVTPQNRIVWEFLNPHRGGPDGELIATLYELIRLDPDYLSR